MRNYLFFSWIIILTIFIMSCNPTTGSDTYNSTWSPSGDSKNTPWKFPSNVEFVQVDKGFQFSATINDSLVNDSLLSYTFTPQIYQVSNITSAKSATVSFKARISSAPDSVSILPSGKISHQFGRVAGTIASSGDSVHFSVKPFTGDVVSIVSLSVNPDSCSLMLRFNVALQWNSFTAGTPANPLPKTKKVIVDVSNIEMKVNGISVLK